MLTPRELQAIKQADMRSRDALSIYRCWMSQQECFHRSRASERLLLGGNRAGKTMAAAAEFASAATGKPILGPDGRPLPARYRLDRPLHLWLIGFDEKHIGQTFYRMLLSKDHGLKMIQDEETDQWRAYNPNTDKMRASEAKDAEPFIPRRMIKNIHYRRAGEDVFTTIKMHSRWPEYEEGTVIHAFSSKADPKAGDPVDLIWIDEKIYRSGHYAEWQARLSDRKGSMYWSSWPARGNEALLGLYRRAEDDEDKPANQRDVEKFQLTFSGNPFIDEDEKRKRIAGWSEAQRVARDKGLFALSNTLCYPTFSAELHGIENPQGSADKIQEVLKATGGQPPQNWCRYFCYDPGQTQAGALFIAVPPPVFGDVAVVYDEMYPQHQTAKEFARDVKRKMAGQPKFQAFLIDGRAGRQTPLSGGMTVEGQFAEAFRQEGLLSADTGYHFQYGSDNIPARMAETREWLGIRDDGTTKLRFVTTRLPNLLKEFERYSRKVNARDEVMEEPEKGNNHIISTLEYLVMHGCRYVAPKVPRQRWDQPQTTEVVHLTAGVAPDQDRISRWNLEGLS